MRALAVTVALVLLVGVAVDAGVTRVAEDRIEQEVRRELASGPVEVDLRGWPVSVRMLLGRVPEVEVRAVAVPLRDSEARLTALDAELRDVRLRLAALADGGPLSAVAGSGTFEARLSEDELAPLVQDPLTLTLEDGFVRIASAGLRIDAVATVEAGRVVLRPAASDLAGLLELSLPLQGLPEGVTVTDVTVQPGELLLRGSIRDLRLTPA